MLRIFLAVACGAIVTVYGAVGVLLQLTASGEVALERALCRYLAYCDDDILRGDLHRRLWSGDRNTERSAIEFAREYLRRSPGSAERWCTLGDAFLRSGEMGSARSAYVRAIKLGPNSPPILMRAAHFAWEIGDTAGYLRHTRRVLSLVSDYDAVIFDGYRRIGADAGQFIWDGLAANPEVAVRYSRYLSDRGGESNRE